jgi:hypothetical protein
MQLYHKITIGVIGLLIVIGLLWLGIIGWMNLFVLFCFFGVGLIASSKRNVRFSGFLLSLIGSTVWCIYGVYIGDANVVFQFVGYSVLNIVGIKNNLKDEIKK